jgi:hypothetical protein
MGLHIEESQCVFFLFSFFYAVKWVAKCHFCCQIGGASRSPCEPCTIPL